MKIKSLLFSSFIIMVIVFIGCQNSTDSTPFISDNVHTVTVSEFEDFIKSITTTDIVNINVTGNYEDFKIKTKLLQKANLKINLDISHLTNVEIGESAFGACYSLVGIKLPENITSVGSQAFILCTQLVNINLPNGITTIGKEAFCLCKSLIGINLPDSITSIEDGAFASCYALKSIILPAGITVINKDVFSDCKELKTVVIPNGVMSIKNKEFYYCTKLESVTFKQTTGWKAGETDILSSDLEDPAKAALYLKETYVEKEWTRS